MSLFDDLKIDVQNLDIEWATLATLHHKYNEQSVILEKNIKILKIKLRTLRADIGREIRRKKDDYLEEGEKITLKLIEEIVDSDDEVIQVEERIIDLEQQRKLIIACAEDIDNKRTALSNLSKLYMSEFYSVPRTDGEMQKFDDAYDDIEHLPILDKIKARLKKKRKKKKEKDNG